MIGNTPQSSASSSYSFDNIESMETSLHEHAMGSQYELPVTSSDVVDTEAAVGPDIESFEVDGDTNRMNPFAVRDSRTLTWRNVHLTLVRFLSISRFSHLQVLHLILPKGRYQVQRRKENSR